MPHRLDTRMVGDPRDLYAQRDGAAVHYTKWAQQVVLNPAGVAALGHGSLFDPAGSFS